MTSTTRLGRDGRQLVTTAMAAYSLDMKPRPFREYARRNHIRPVAADRPSGVGRPAALWDLADLALLADKIQQRATAA